MKYTKFKFANFKGIEEMTFDLEKSPDANIYTLVGLNESGKTTILEAMNLFSPNDQGLSALEIPGATIRDYDFLVPISKRDNFNGTVTIEVHLELDDLDRMKINEFVAANTPFQSVVYQTHLTYYRHYSYENSVFKNYSRKWSGFSGYLKGQPSVNTAIGDKSYPEVNDALAGFCRNLIPSILYFPNFLFDFPTRIYLKQKQDPTAKEKFYIDLVQDILHSLENETTIQTHLVGRIGNAQQKKHLDRLVQLMERKVTEVVFDAWNRVFGRKFRDMKVIIEPGIGDDDLPYLEFQIEAENGIYQINERSLGFRWFFVFLLFTQFRPFRKDTPGNIMFLFDEPASNLHSTAQKQLLKSFEKLIEDCKIIYTTHSHHLINPQWLESTYVVRNEGLNLNDVEHYNIKETKISIQPYREFVAKHPHNTAYFQPILDVLEYVPGELELIPDCVFLEGKNDYYALSYASKLLVNPSVKVNLAPSTGSGNLDTLISLYLGWGRRFVVLLDSDKEGEKQKQRYIEKFGSVVSAHLYTLADIEPSWKGKEFEKLFTASELLSIQVSCYPETTTFNKTHFNRAVQENLMRKRAVQVSPETLENLSLVLSFLKGKLAS